VILIEVCYFIINGAVRVQSEEFYKMVHNNTQFFFDFLMKGHILLLFSPRTFARPIIRVICFFIINCHSKYKQSIGKVTNANEETSVLPVCFPKTPKGSLSFTKVMTSLSTSRYATQNKQFFIARDLANICHLHVTP
jgi:hypothetical protein